MKMKYLSVMITCLFSAGCGNIDWFPNNTSSTTNTHTTTSTSPTLTKAFSPAAILAETTTSTLTFTITNATGNPAQSGLTFTDQLPAGLTAQVDLSQCGGTVEFTPSNMIIFGGGKLASGAANCKITATVSGANSGNDVVSLTNKATNVTDLHGGLVSNLTDQTLKVFPSSVKDSTGTITASNLQTVPSASGTDTLFTFTVDVANTGTVAAGQTVNLVAVDANGAAVRDTGGTNEISTFFPNDSIAAGGTVHLTTTGGPFSADVTNQIKFWRISTVSKS